MIALRSYQEQMVERGSFHMRTGQRRVLFVLPTGGGKRIIAGHTIMRAAEKGKRACFIVHRKELLDQTCKMFDEVGVRYGVIAAGACPHYHRPVQVASVQTLARRLGQAGDFDFLTFDEAHHLPAAGWSAVADAYPSAYTLGYSASPQRLDGRGLGKHFDAMVVGPSMRSLIDGGYLADYRIYAPPAPQTTARTVAGDYDRGQLAADLDQPRIVGDVVAHYSRFAGGSQAIAFAVNILHSRHIAEALNAAGISARHADGETPAAEREMIMRDFAKGRFQVLTSVDLFGEGLDIPGIETVICARPTASLTVFLQQIGRGLRVKPSGKPCIVLDHAGNTARHGLPDDDREWSLDDAPTRARKPGEVSVRICPKCFAAVRPTIRRCECGHQFIVETAVPDHAEGELAPVDLDAVRFERRREQGMADGLEALIEVGRRRGMRHPEGWARHVWAARQRKRA